MTRPFRRPASIRGRLRGLIFTFVLLAILILAAAMSLMVRYNSRYKDLMYNVTTASEFNQDFKASIDLKMYYYVIESQYSEGLPLDEVVRMVSAANPAITDLAGFVIMATIPFNLLKYALNYGIAHVLYHRLVPSLRGFQKLQAEH